MHYSHQFLHAGNQIFEGTDVTYIIFPAWLYNLSPILVSKHQVLSLWCRHMLIIVNATKFYKMRSVCYDILI